MFTLTQLKQAATDIYQIMPPTPQYNWPLLAHTSGCEVWVKHENHTPTTAFKVRGGINLVNHLLESGNKPKGIISATRGNHGQSLSYAGSRARLPVTIVVPESNDIDQNNAIKGHGATLIIHGEDFEAARQHSLTLQQSNGYHMVAPFERSLVLGVASYALELLTTVKELHTIYVPIGMGSGICGLIKTRDLLNLKTEIVGVVAQGAPTFALSFAAGKIINTDQANTIADGVATRAPCEQAFDMIKQGASRVITVNDQQIARAMYQYYQTTHNLSEGAGAVPLAGLMKERQQMKGKKVGLILSGGNINFDQFSQHVSTIKNPDSM